VDSCLGKDILPNVDLVISNNLDCCRYQKSHWAHTQWDMLESVDCWPMANIIHKTFGGKLMLVSAFSVTGRKVSSS
jgi:hypothetical protein